MPDYADPQFALAPKAQTPRLWTTATLTHLSCSTKPNTRLYTRICIALFATKWTQLNSPAKFHLICHLMAFERLTSDRRPGIRCCWTWTHSTRVAMLSAETAFAQSATAWSTTRLLTSAFSYIAVKDLFGARRKQNAFMQIPRFLVRRRPIQLIQSD